MAKVIQVIETEITRGKGVKDDPFRAVPQYWTFDGTLLAENDPCATVIAIEALEQISALDGNYDLTDAWRIARGVLAQRKER